MTRDDAVLPGDVWLVETCGCRFILVAVEQTMKRNDFGDDIWKCIAHELPGSNSRWPLKQFTEWCLPRSNPSERGELICRA